MLFSREVHNDSPHLGGILVKAELLLAVSITICVACLGGCGGTRGDVAGPGSLATSDPAPSPAGGGSSRIAAGHFAHQLVEFTDRDGNSVPTSFRADYQVFSDGTARGSLLMGTDGSFQVVKFTEGHVACREGTDVVLLGGILRSVGPSGGEPATEFVEAEIMPVDADHPECIIWDIKDSCSNTEGKYDVLEDPCAPR